MKITMFLGGLAGGGAERVVCNLANYLSGKGHRVEIVTVSDVDPAYSLNDDVKHIRLIHRHERANPIHNHYLRFLRLRKYMKESDTDAYVVMLPVTTLILLGMRRYTRAPIILSERANPATYPEYIRFLLKRLARYASGFVFQTADVQRWYAPYIRDIPATVIPNAINGEIFVADRPIMNRKKKIIGVGRLDKAKNFKLLLEAFAKIHWNYPEYRLVIYGEGPERSELETLIKNLGLSGFVEMPGFVSDIGEKIQNASMFVLSSDHEGMPNALIEAMALGVPCVATDCPAGGPRFLIEDGGNGLLVPVGDAAALADAMRKLLDDGEYAKNLGNRAREIKNRLAPDKIYGEWERFIGTVCGGK